MRPTCELRFVEVERFAPAGHDIKRMKVRVLQQKFEAHDTYGRSTHEWRDVPLVDPTTEGEK